MTVTSDRYVEMLQSFVAPALNNFPQLHEAWFQKDGATSHKLHEAWFQKDGATSHTAR